MSPLFSIFFQLIGVLFFRVKCVIINRLNSIFMRFSRFASLIIGVMMMGLGVAVIVNPPVSEAAFGTSPPWVRNDHLLPGTTYEQIINLSRNETDNEMQVNVRLDGDKEILKWLKIEDQKKLIMKVGQKSLPMKVIVKVPKNAALKDYRGGIFVTLESIKNETTQKGGSVAIKLGAHILVELSVIGTKVTDFRIKSITLDTLSQGENFHLNIEIENLGNTEITDVNGQVDIYDKKETEVIKSVTFGKLADPVAPDDVIRTKVNFPDLILDPGEYWIIAKIFKNNKAIYENRLYQKVEEKVVPVITPEDVGVKKPSIPKSAEAPTPAAETVTGQPSVAPAPQVQTIIHEVAPAQNNSLVIMFGIVSLGFGLLAMVTIIILLIVLIRNQRQATIQRYLTAQKNINE